MKVLQSRILLVLAAVLVVAGGVGYWQFVKNKPTVKPLGAALECPLQDLKLELKSEWKEYTSQNFKVAFSYPKEFEVNELKELWLTLPQLKKILNNSLSVGCRSEIVFEISMPTSPAKTAQEELERLFNLSAKNKKINLAGTIGIWNESEFNSEGKISIYLANKNKVYTVSISRIPLDLQGNFSSKHVEIFKAILETIRFTD